MQRHELDEAHGFLLAIALAFIFWASMGLVLWLWIG